MRLHPDRNGETTLNTKRQGFLLVAGLAGVGLPALIGYARTVQPHSDTHAATNGASASQPQVQAERTGRGDRLPIWKSISPDLFTRSPADQPEAPTIAVAPAAVARHVVTISTAIDPLASYAYTGTVTVDGVVSALLEHRTTHQSWYVRPGDAWETYRVLDVNNHEVTIDVNGARHTLPKSNEVNVVPMIADARQDGSAFEGGTDGNANNRGMVTMVEALNGLQSTPAQLPMVLSRVTGGGGATPGLPNLPMRLNAERMSAQIGGAISSLWQSGGPISGVVTDQVQTVAPLATSSGTVILRLR